MSARIDLAQFRSGRARVYAGRPRGEVCRRKAGLDDLDARGETIEVYVPRDTVNVTSSFCLGMFRRSIKCLGEAEFRNRYQFTGWSRMGDVIDRCISEATLA